MSIYHVPVWEWKYHNKNDELITFGEQWIKEGLNILEIIVEPLEFPIKNVYDLLSLPNLTKLYLLNIEFSCIRKDYLALRNHKQLTWFAVALCDGSDDWSEIEFPQGLKSLSLITYDYSDYYIKTSTLIIPKSVYRLEISRLLISFEELSQKLPPHLTVLRLNAGLLKTIRVYQFSIALRVLQISKTELERIAGTKCPPNLNEIDFSGNKLGDNGFEVINTIGWPEGLTRLNISKNEISRIDLLKSLPHRLHTLDISGNPFIWPDGQVFEFPCNLKSLEMERCELKDLKHIKFPISLVKLNLRRNDITNISAYDDWSSLINLRILDVFLNSISSFDNWEIPPNVIQLYLGYNPIENLTSKFPLFNCKYNFNVVKLVLKGCNLTTLEIDYIPLSLKQLDLSFNKFSEVFVFPSIFKKLNHLKLYRNRISSIVFDEKDDTKSCLHRLELSYINIMGENPSSESINEFYDTLEKNLGKVKQRDAYGNRLIDFEKCHSSSPGSFPADNNCRCRF